MQPLRFPKSFVWGVAAAAPQIEGAAFTDGKAASVWDTFCRVPGAVKNGDTLDVACDHYHRFDQDFALMRSLGIKHYRLSIAWPRILPAGRGRPNPRGIDFYHRLFDSLEKHGITPWVTMFHWDLPQALEDEGGWRRRSIAGAFGEYADIIVKAYRDRVKHWFTLNEIFCFTELGYGNGQKAPGKKEGAAIVNQTFHHTLLCHGQGVRAVREHGGRGAKVGIVDNPIVPVPLTLNPADIAAARTAFIAENIRVLDPLFRGRYAESYLKSAGRDAPVFERSDFELIAAPTDFIGLNIYTGQFVRAGKRGRPEKISFPPNYPRTDCNWHYLLPQSLYWGPRFVSEIYRAKKIYITEQGAGYDEPPVEGEFPDLHRRECVRNYLVQLRHAMADGHPVAGYFLWSLMDNYEWEDGYDRRFGIIHNDFKIQKRTPKLSARWYSQVIRRGELI